MVILLIIIGIVLIVISYIYRPISTDLEHPVSVEALQADFFAQFKISLNYSLYMLLIFQKCVRS